jgi:hypothetical protein
MLEFNIHNFPTSIKKNIPLDIDLIFEKIQNNKLLDNNKPSGSFENSFINEFKSSNKLEKKIKIHRFLGQGSYGIVFKVSIDDKYFALKLSDNEIPERLIKRYNSLIDDKNIKKYIIKIYSCGTLIDSKKKYYALMEFGGIDIRKYKYQNPNEVLEVIKQLYNLVNSSINGRHLITDFKSGNLILNPKNMNLKLIDIYMFCDEYPCKNCKIVKTYPIIEIEKEYKIYENKDYNFTFICVPLAIILIDLCCEKTFSKICSELGDKYNLDISVKQFAMLIQLACYNYNNNNDNSNLKNYRRICKFKKNTEKEFDILKNCDFYKDFFNKLDTKHVFSKKKFILLINDLFSACPDQRSIKYLKKKIENISSNK